jgi:cytochrome b561
MTKAAAIARSDYRISQKVVLWLMALFIMLDLFVAQKFADVMTDADRFESRSDHATIGTVVTLLLLLRVYLRWKHGVPPLPVDLPHWQKRAARFGHWALYGLLFLLVLSGLVTAVNANSVVAPFGQFPLYDGAGLQATFQFFRNIHEWTTNLIIVMIAIHILAALYHPIVNRDKLTGRMLRFWRTE